MPSFVCDRCQETLKKPKLDQHTQRCRGASFSCIDCYRSFKGTDYRGHFSCITEVEKYEKKKPAPATTVAQHKAETTTTTTTTVTTQQKAEKRPAPADVQGNTVKVPKIAPTLSKVILETVKRSSGAVTLKDLKKTLKRGKQYGKKELKRLLQNKIVFTADKNSGGLLISIHE